MCVPGVKAVSPLAVWLLKCVLVMTSRLVLRIVRPVFRPLRTLSTLSITGLLVLSVLRVPRASIVGVCAAVRNCCSVLLVLVTLMLLFVQTMGCLVVVSSVCVWVRFEIAGGVG